MLNLICKTPPCTSITPQRGWAVASGTQDYVPTNTGVTPYWIEKYERGAKRYWDEFYKRHQDKFFKDRHYLHKDWGNYFSGAGRKVILEVGCGAGNTIFPVIASYPDVFVYACDFSSRAIELVKMHKGFKESCVSVFVSDLTADDLCKEISPSSVDIVTMIFMLSAVSPEKMPLVLQNIKKVIKPNGYVLFRDYAAGDLAQEKLSGKAQKINDNFYVRGDGTRAYYFSNEFLTNLFKENGFDVEELSVYCKQFKNRSRKLLMNRRWVRAAFRISDVSTNYSSSKEAIAKANFPSIENIDQEVIKENCLKCIINSSTHDLSKDVPIDMSGISSSEIF